MGNTSVSQPVKPKNIFSFVIFVAYHFITFGSIALPIYALISQNYYLLGLFTFVVAVQLNAKKSKTLVNFISKHMHPSLAFNSFQVIDDWRDGN